LTGQQTSGLLFTFEGLDGCGKSLQASSLVKRLKERGFDARLVRDPGGPPIAEAIRKILLDRDHHAMSPMTELFLYEAARAQLVAEYILPALDEGSLVVCDRYVDSTTAYQSYGRGLPLDFINRANRQAAGRAWPVRTYVLDIPWDESKRRRLKAGTLTDRMESDIAHFHQLVIEGYHEIVNREPDRVKLLDGCRSVNTLEHEIFQDVLYILENRVNNNANNEKE
jgi:dTMP kinase